MSSKIISKLSRSLIEVAWQFGPKGINGECCDDLSLPEFLALDKVSTATNCRVQDIGVFLGFTKSGATRIVNRLEKKGYVSRIKSLEDARVCCVSLTEMGEEVLRKADERYKKQFSELLNKMPTHSADSAEEVLTSMAEAFKK